MPKKVQSIYTYFNEYPKEMIDEVINNLSEEEHKLLVARYGDDLNNPQPSDNFSKEDSVRFYGTLISKIKRQLKYLNNRRNNLASITYAEPGDNSKEEVVEKHSHEIKQEEPVQETPTEQVQVAQAPIEQLLVEKTNQNAKNSTNSLTSKDGLKEVFELLTKPSFTTLLEVLTPKEAIIFCLRLGTTGKAYKANDIAEFLEIDIQDVYDTTNKALDAFHANVDMLLEKEQEKIQALKLSIKNYNK